MDEDVGLGLVVRLGISEEIPVGFGDAFESVIGFEGGAAALGFEPVGEIGFVDGGEEEFFLMVSVEAGDGEFLLEADDEFNDAFGIGAAVDVVTDKDEVVIGLRGNDFDHFLKRDEAAVEVTDGESSHDCGRRISSLRRPS